MRGRVLFVGLALGALGTLAACDAPANRADVAGHPYPASAEATFRRDFSDSPGLGTCVLAATEKRYSYNEFLSVSHAYAGTGDLPPSIKAIVDACVARLQ